MEPANSTEHEVHCVDCQAVNHVAAWPPESGEHQFLCVGCGHYNLCNAAGVPTGGSKAKLDYPLADSH